LNLFGTGSADWSLPGASAAGPLCAEKRASESQNLDSTLAQININLQPDGLYRLNELEEEEDELNDEEPNEDDGPELVVL